MNINTITYVNGADVTVLTDQNLFDHISHLRTQLTDLAKLGISGPAYDANKTKLEAKVVELEGLVNARYEESAPEVA